MLVRVIITAFVLMGVAAWGEPPPPWPVSGPMPDAPVSVPRTHYSDVGAGTKVYVPVEPMPWGNVNKRVAPKSENEPGHDGH